ncbi:UDP-glucose 6-dehydrogenase [gamma proteobacterium HdN1]|nr:UDP-glucose 6-dehydrogenase [gamma proteobacterium HdN1]
MRVSIFGSGYVGLVTGACLAEMGNHVICVDVDARKIDALKRGEIPIFEPGLDSLIARNAKSGHIQFTTDAKAAVQHGECIFIAVGTPPDEDGSADLQYVLAVARTIGENITGYKVVVDKSTVPVGTADKVAAEIAAAQKRRGSAVEVDVVSNPEFLKEGAAIADFMKPDRIIIGTSSSRAAELMGALYAPFNRNRDRVMVMDTRSAELTKYAANAMLATKISFMNELASIAERVGADIEFVRQGIGSDPRIGFQFIYPGCGYGGSCFPKDVKALSKIARNVGYVPRMMEATDLINEDQKNVMFAKIKAHFGDDLKGKVIALWGLSFKPNTDDMREAPSRNLMEALWEAGASVRAYDPEAMDETRRIYEGRSDLVLCASPEEAVDGADALALLTEWNLFRSPDFENVRERLKQPVLFDGRNVYHPEDVRRHGFSYYGIGRL